MVDVLRLMVDVAILKMKINSKDLEDEEDDLKEVEEEHVFGFNSTLFSSNCSGFSSTHLLYLVPSGTDSVPSLVLHIFGSRRRFDPLRS